MDKVHRAKRMQVVHKFRHALESDCHECNGFGRYETVVGDRSTWDECTWCERGKFNIDPEPQMHYANEETWHGSNEEKD